jgi:cytochrome c oxidase assembly factor CtaG
MRSEVGMSAPSVTALGPILVLLAVLATDVWVYGDAKANTERGTPVVFSLGTFEIDTPLAWLLGCLLLWIVFFPLYMTRRGDGG